MATHAFGYGLPCTSNRTRIHNVKEEQSAVKYCLFGAQTTKSPTKCNIKIVLVPFGLLSVRVDSAATRQILEQQPSWLLLLLLQSTRQRGLDLRRA